jgi:CBS domain-containing protein
VSRRALNRPFSLEPTYRLGHNQYCFDSPAEDVQDRRAREDTMKVKEILREKGSSVKTIAPEAPVREVVDVLTAHSIGALVVVDESKNIVGIVTERDVLRRCIREEDPDLGKPVRSIMTEDVIVGVPDDEVDYVMHIITENKIRHLPIVMGKNLVGLVSIGDVVKSVMKEMEFENRHLKDYIKSGG